MPKIKAPGVFIRELGNGPKSIAAQPTALPAFIGYTEFAHDKDAPLAGVPYRISSMSDFERCFGGAPKLMFEMGTSRPATGPAPLSDDGARLPPDLPMATLNVPQASPSEYELRLTGRAYTLFAALRLFFDNGGETAYVVSVGSYDDPIKARAMRKALRKLKTMDEPTLIVAPDATRLSRAKAAKVNRKMLAHCQTSGKRFAIIDIPGGHLSQTGPRGNPIDAFQEDIGATALDYGAAYYPWLNAGVFQALNFTYDNLDASSRATLTSVLKQEQPDLPHYVLKALSKPLDREVDTALRSQSHFYVSLTQALADCANTVPAGGALAGLYAQTDRARGVWKAPAGMTIAGVTGLAQPLNTAEQEALSNDASGVSINPIAVVPGRGIHVWGARTLHRTSGEWRYVPVRRMAMMIEDSISKALASFVFQPNTEETWRVIRSVIENFLGTLWRQGAMQGQRSDDAFFVRVGLGDTMTEADIDQGIINVTVGFAPLKPAEFVIVRIQQKTASP